MMASLPSPVREHFAPEEYLALERVSEFRNEYHDGEIVPMAGGSRRHTLILMNLYRELSAASLTHGFQAFPSEMKVWIPGSRRYYYPDFCAVAGAPPDAEDDADVIENPTLVIEVLSPSTETKDRGTKFKHYRQIAGLSQYALISQSSPQVEVYTLRDGFWVYQVYSELEETVEFQSLGVSLPMAAVYLGVRFAPAS